mgnify:CR=1 FL=1
MKILIVSCSLHPESRSRRLAGELESVWQGTEGAAISTLDLRDLDLPACDGTSAYGHPDTIKLFNDAFLSFKEGEASTVTINGLATEKKFPGSDNDGENVFFNLQEKPDAKYFFMVAAKDIKAGNELTANYNLYTYPKTGVGLQMI